MSTHPTDAENDPRDRRDNGRGTSEYVDEQGADAPGSVEESEGAPEPGQAASEAENGTAGEQDTTGEDDGEDHGDGKLVSRLRREAAGHRTRLREVEGHLEVERQKVATLQAAAIRRESGIDPAILARAGIRAEELTDDSGVVDPDRVAEAIDGVRRSLGLGAAGARPGPGGGGLDGGAEHRGGGEDALVAALRPRRR